MDFKKALAMAALGALAEEETEGTEKITHEQAEFQAGKLIEYLERKTVQKPFPVGSIVFQKEIKKGRGMYKHPAIGQPAIVIKNDIPVDYSQKGSVDEETMLLGIYFPNHPRNIAKFKVDPSFFELPEVKNETPEMERPTPAEE